MDKWYTLYTEGVSQDMRQFSYVPSPTDFKCSYDSRTNYEVVEMDVKKAGE